MRYTREDACRAWLTYGLVPADSLTELLNEFGSAEAIYDRFQQHGGSFLKRKVNEFGIAQLTQNAQKDRMHQMLLAMQKLDVGILALDDALYPDMLRDIQSPPALLFYRGDLSCLMGKCISVVGSRNASVQGIEATKRICCDLSCAGVAVISGMAMGIDAAAHEGCLEGGSPTVAILASGIDVDYPVENVDLKDRIVANGGLLLSECPMGARPNKFVFQVRNRIISGLGKALLMMESQIQSGSMLTVHHALDQGKEVFAYPGQPGTEWAEGAHQLLREGANYFTGAQDILEDLGWEDGYPPVTAQKTALPSMNENQHQIFRLLGQGELSFDQLAAQTTLPPSALSVELTMLQMMGVIKALPGKLYCRV